MRSRPRLRRLPENYPFDYYCWDLYTQVGLFYRDGDPDGELESRKD